MQKTQPNYSVNLFFCLLFFFCLISFHKTNCIRHFFSWQKYSFIFLFIPFLSHIHFTLLHQGFKLYLPLLREENKKYNPRNSLGYVLLSSLFNVARSNCNCWRLHEWFALYTTNGGDIRQPYCLFAFRKFEKKKTNFVYIYSDVGFLDSQYINIYILHLWTTVNITSAVVHRHL